MEEIKKKFRPRKLSTKQKVILGIFMVLSLAVALPLSINLLFLNNDVPFSIRKEWVNVHLIPHSHVDVGWLNTPEEYYNRRVRYILNNVVTELHRDSSKRFVFAETYFFWRWWQEQEDSVRAIVKEMIHSKRLEIIGGGICMSDEAVTHYQSFIDQSTWGFRLLNDTLGPDVVPTVAWQIDTFGHSQGIASLLAQMGFTSLFFARISVHDRECRKRNGEMEFVWWPNTDLGMSNSIFTSIFYDHYSSPRGFDFESQPETIRIDYLRFATYARQHSQTVRTANILVPMGDDFRYMNARKYYKKMDELINYFKHHREFKLNVFYSTPSMYIDSLLQSSVTWPAYYGDFFPYASDYSGFWTGFFTSRPTLKYFERISNNFLQISKQLLTMSGIGVEFFDELTTLREALGVLQHHDAVTGTSQQHVTDHYVELLQGGIDNCAKPADIALGILSERKTNFTKQMYESCLLLNISSCPITELTARFVVTVYNPLSRPVNQYVRVPILGKSYVVTNGLGKTVRSQIVAIPKTVRSIPGRTSRAKSELVFRATNVPAMGFKSYYVSEDPTGKSNRKGRSSNSGMNVKSAIDKDDDDQIIGFKIRYKNATFCQTMKYYQSVPKYSGAYLFGPINDKSHYVGTKASVTLINDGELVREYEQIFSNWASQIVRTYEGEDYVEMEWLIGPIPMEDDIGKEVITLYQSDVKSGNVYYTDVNGMNLRRRTRNLHDWQRQPSPTVSGNYYPVTTTMMLEDETTQMFVVVDRPEGGASLESGEIELMLHRRLFYDDFRGVIEPLNEMSNGVGLVVRGRHWVLFGDRSVQTQRKGKLLSQMQHSPPWLFFLDATFLSLHDWRTNFITEFSGLVSPLPNTVRILTLEPWRENTVLLRLEYVFQKVGCSTKNQEETVCLSDLFRTFDVIDVRETALGADRWLSDVTRLKWNSVINANCTGYNDDSGRGGHDLCNFMITLKPEQIRTFIVTIKAKD